MHILQRYFNGLLINYPDLNILINEFRPEIISLQETLYPPNKYHSYFHNSIQNSNVKEEIAIFIKKSVNHKQIPSLA